MHDFRVCPSCRYGRGFHVSFKAVEDGLSIVLICPDCGQSYEPGWMVSVTRRAPLAGPAYAIR
jgi:hypothetical protein